ncbi:hypothetical protein N665_0019s0026 [Sinapis alba]|nr:hypothetical protein N665_0019s0026 [Sinapis alba]
MVSARLVDCPDEPEESEVSPNPDMMFAVGEEPVGVRVLTYQSSSALKWIFNALEDDEVDIIRRSSFGKLIDIADKPVFSGRFARYMLSRQMKTKKKHENWFRFAGKPVRFSLREFAIMKLKETLTEKPYWPCLLGRVEVVTVSSVIKMLYRKTVKDTEIRIKYACLALLESVLLPTSLKMKISRDHAEAIKDLEAFFAYPWGRVAFDMLMVSIKERDDIALSRDTIVVKGFALALQLVMVEVVPTLTEVVQDTCSSSESDSEDIDGNGCDVFVKKQSLNPAHARNVDKRTDVNVRSVLVEDPLRPIGEANVYWSDEEHDSRVEVMLACIKHSYPFNITSFRSGVRRNEIDRMREAYSNGEAIEPGYIAGIVIEKIKPQFDLIESNLKMTSTRVATIEGNVDAQVESLFGKFKEQMIASVKELVCALCKEHLVVPNGTGSIPTSGPNVETVPPSQTNPVADSNALAIQNILRDISEYSTPPRSTRLSENVTPTNKDHVDSGYVSVTPVPQSCAQSANSQYRSRQNSFQESLGHARQPPNLADEPSFSLGLTQDEQIQGDEPILGKERDEGEPIIDINVADNMEEGQISRKSKRQKTVPTGLVEDYQCGPHLLSRQRESQRCIFKLEDISDLRRKYAKLVARMKSNFVLNVSGLAVYAREILLIVERPHISPAKVVDILVRVLRPAISQKLPNDGPRSAAFLDIKFVSSITRNISKFLRSKNKEGYVFPKGLRDIFPTKDAPQPHPTRYHFPFNVANQHWVGICFDAGNGILTILDCDLASNKDSALEKIINPLVQMLPYLGRYACQSIGADHVIQCYDVARPKSVSQNKNPADSGLMAVLLMANHALYGLDGCKNIS